MEITFLRRDGIKKSGGYIYSGHPLDSDNNPLLPSIKLSGLGLA